MKNDDYPHDDNPANGWGPAESWNPRQAKEYLNWYLDTRQARRDIFEEYLSLSMDSEENLLKASLSVENYAIETRVRRQVRSVMDSHILYEPSMPAATMASDFGTCCALVAEDRHKGVFIWKIGPRPRSDMQFNRPVIGTMNSFKKRRYIDPVGGCVRLAHGITNGKASADDLADIYSAVCGLRDI